MPDTMKAALAHDLGALENISVEETEIPELKEGELLIRVEAAGVNPVDAAIVKGHLQRALPHELPIIPGWDFAGTVEGRGFGARRFQEGDKVYGYARRPLVKWGTFSEYVVIPEPYVAERPENIPPEEAGGLPLVALTAYQSIYEAGNLREGDSVLILGASGGVGSVAVQLAKIRGATVIGVASRKNHEYMQDLGADETVDYHDTDVGKVVKQAHPDGVDLIFDCTGGQTLQESLPALKQEGKLVSIRDRGENLAASINHEYVFVEPNASQLDALRKLVEGQKLKVHVSDTFGLEESIEALQQIETLHTKGKIVIVP